MAIKVEKGYEFGGFKLGQKVIYNGVEREIIAFDEGESIWKIGLEGENEYDFEYLVESVKYYRESSFAWVRLVDVRLIKESTLIEKIAEHFGVEIGEEFNVYHEGHEDITIPFNPYKFNERTLCNCYGNFVPEVMNNLILGEYILKKFPKF